MSTLQQTSFTPLRLDRATRAAAALLGALLVAASALLATTPAHAAPLGPDGNGISYETNVSTHTATVTGYSGSATVVIPDTITDGVDSYSVTTIGDGAFNTKGLTSITLPDTITHIGNAAFRQNLLTSVTIPDAVAYIGNGAFTDNTITSVTLGKGFIYIDGGAFNANQLSSVSIPASVTEIRGVAFAGSPLTSAVFQGAPPIISAAGPGESLNTGSGLTVYYPSALSSNYDPSSTGTWEGYTAAPGATLSYDLGGHGSAIDSVTVAPNNVAATATPVTPSATGYTFGGWFTAITGGTAFDFGAPLAADTTAFARWAAVGGSTPAAPSLPVTGIDPTPLGITGLLALLLGGMALAWARRRSIRNRSHTPE